MITENPNPEQENEEKNTEEISVENSEIQHNVEETEEVSEEKTPASSTETELTNESEITDSEEIATEEQAVPQTEIVEETPSVEEPQEVLEKKITEASSEEHQEKTHEEEDDDHEHHGTIQKLSLPQLLVAMEKIINSENSGVQYKKFHALRDNANEIIQEEIQQKKQEFLDGGNAEEDFRYEHPSAANFNSLVHIYKEKQDAYHKNQEEEQEKNLEIRHQIIERLKNLYSNTEVGTNLFKEIREIKEAWSDAGQVAKSKFKILNNDYFFHLQQFYSMLDLNKEYLEQEYSHNLEKRQHIIERAKELVSEPSVQKALNELQFLHKLWKEEAEPVAEEHRETTWDEFREVSNQIHERKSELNAQLDAEQQSNLEKKNSIIEAIKKIASPEKGPNHNYWQNSIKKVEELRSEFLKLGSVPRKISNQNWNDFKQILRDFNHKKNQYYKDLKDVQHKNLDEKMKLIETAKANMNSDDWETLVPLYKSLQNNWKKIGHVPRSHANTLWNEFREACNTFFNNYRDKNNMTEDNWKENYAKKKALLDELNSIQNEDGSIEQIEQIKTNWNNIGKVPKEHLKINTEFNKALRKKLKINNISELELKEEGLSGDQLTDKARKIKSQIADLEAEIAKLENNLGFFSNSSRENLLLKETYDKIDEKKEHLENMKQNLHNIITSE